MRFAPCLLLGCIVIASCTKRGQLPLPRLNTWVVDEKTFYKQSAHWDTSNSMNTIYFNDDSLNGLGLTFTHKPTNSKMYKIVYQPQSDDEVSIEEWRNNNGRSGSQDGVNKYLTVTKTDNGLNFATVSIPLRHYTWVVDYNVSCAFNLSE